MGLRKLLRKAQKTKRFLGRIKKIARKGVNGLVRGAAFANKLSGGALLSDPRAAAVMGGLTAAKAALR